MRKIFHLTLLLPFWIIFILIMILSHPILLIASLLPTTTLFDRLIVIHNWLHILNLRLTTLTQISKEIASLPDQNKPLVIISNHQNIYDVALLVTTFSKTTPFFVAKKQLSKWIPSVSLILRKRNGIIIDRSAGKEALEVIGTFAKRIDKENICCVIFPEGTRAKDGNLKPFKLAGLKKILQEAPEASVVPVGIAGNWKILNPNFFPFFHKVSMKVFYPIDRTQPVETQLELIESQIRAYVSPQTSLT